MTLFAETFKDSVISDGDNILHLEVCNLTRVNQPGNIKWVGVCLNFKECNLNENETLGNAYYVKSI